MPPPTLPGPYSSDDPYAALRVSLGTPAPPARRGQSRRLVLLLVALGVVVVLAGVQAVRILGDRPVPPVDGRDPRNVPALSVYMLSSGPHGKLLEVGQPWGFSCAPVLFRLGTGMPAGEVKQFESVVDAARRVGFNVAAVRGSAEPAAGSLVGEAQLWRVVPVAYSTKTPGPNELGKPQAMNTVWDSRVTFDGGYENLTSMRFTVFGRTTAGDALLQRKVARLAVARAFGVFGARSTSSGITQLMQAEADAFTGDDIAAIRAMSGCPPPRS